MKEDYNHFDDKLQKLFRIYQWKRLAKVPKNHHRFTAEVMSQTALSFYLKIGQAHYWLPRKSIKVGIHPRGSYYAADIPQWLIDKHPTLKTCIK